MARLDVRSEDPLAVERMCRDYAASRDAALRDRIVLAYGWLVRACVQQHRHRGEPTDDLVQVGYVGLIRAIESFDPRFGVAFRSYASATIVGHLRRHYRSTWRVHVPRRVQEMNYRASVALDVLTQVYGRSPTTAEIAEHLHADEDDVIEGLAAGTTCWPLSLSSPDGDGPDTEWAVSTSDTSEEGDLRVTVIRCLGRLSERHRAIVYLRFFHDLTQTEIAEELGISQVHVSRLLRSAIRCLRHELRADEGAAGSESGSGPRGDDRAVVRHDDDLVRASRRERGRRLIQA
jgi:RNA polymerase sigma-B factor